MARMYLSYVNNGKQGLTWRALVAGALILMDKPSAVQEVILFIWGKKNPPIQLSQMVTSTLVNMEEHSLVTRLKRGNYGITLLGKKIFTQSFDYDQFENLRNFSDSKLFNSTLKTKKRRYRRSA